MDNALAMIPTVAAFEVGAASHPGLVQTENEDSWDADAALGLAVVADGVGGHENGAGASRAAVEAVLTHLRVAAAQGLTPETDAAARLARENHVRRAVAHAHDRLVAANAGRTEHRRRSGATLAGVWAPFGAGSFVTVFHVGDSRVYRLREGRLVQLTRDHSAYEEWRRAGEIGAPPSQKYILQALGVSREVKPDIHSFTPAPGDRLLICSDGVCGDVRHDEIVRSLQSGAPDQASETLVALALDHGGRDNATAVVCSLHS